jgi:hypothetical protein
VAWYYSLYAPRTVFVTGSDLVRLGFVTSLNRPGGNMTGVELWSIACATSSTSLSCLA